MKNIHILPTNKPSRLIWYTTGGYHLLKEPIFIDAPLKPSRHIYITSGEEIKEGDWYIINSKYISKCVRRSKTYINGSFITSGCKKII